MKAKRSSFDPTVIVLLIVGAAAYSNSLSGPFIFDDDTAIVRNPDIRHLWPLWSTTESELQHSVCGRPLVRFSLAVNYALGELDVRGYHVFNIAVHVLCAMTLYGIVRRTLLCERLGGRFSRSARFVGLACALIWMVHPLQTQCVNYITHRSESIMGLFYLLTLYCSIRASNSNHRPRWQGAAVIACALGMATKEAMATAPLMVLLYDWAFRPVAFKQVLRRRWGLYAWLASTWIILGILVAPGPRSKTVGFSLPIGVVDYAMNQCKAIVQYLRLTFWPHPLIIDYGSPESLQYGEVAPYAAVVLLLLAATIAALAYRPMIGFLGAWFFVILGPTSSFIPILNEVAAERRVYLPLAGIVVLLVIAGHALLERAPRPVSKKKRTGAGAKGGGFQRCISVAGVTVFVVVLACATVLRNRDYRSALTLWQDVVAERPQNARGYDNLGHALIGLGRYDEAVDALRKSLQLDPNGANAHSNLGTALWHKRNLEESILHLERAVQLKPQSATVRKNLAVALHDYGLSRRSKGAFDQAIEAFQLALRYDPSFAPAHGELAITLDGQGRPGEALAACRRAIAAAPQDADFLTRLGSILMRAGKPEEAVQAFEEALKLEPDHYGTLYNLGVAWATQHRIQEASRAFRRATIANPAFAPAHFNLGNTLAQQGRFREAVAAYREVLKLQPDHGGARRALDAALAKLDHSAAPQQP